MKASMAPLVSVLVPVYNVEKYLTICLNSLINQTMKDIEIVCVNDGSTDGSADILKFYAAQDKRIVIVNKQNGGLPSARNAGINVARGMYVGFIDGDDYAAPDMFEKMYKAARKNDADIVVCGAHPFPDEEAAPKWLKDDLSPEDGTYTGSNIDTLLNVRGVRPFVWRDLVKKKLIDDNNFRLDESIIVGEDLAFQFKIFAKAKTVTLISDKLYFYRYNRPDSIMNSGSYYDYGTRISKHVNMFESIANSWQKMGIFEQNKVMFFDWAVDFLYWDIIRITVQDRVKIAEKFCNLLIDLGYYTCVKQLKNETRDHFKYINSLCGKKFPDPAVTIVAVAESCGNYLYNYLNSVIEQSRQDIEVLLYDNNSNDQTHIIAREFLYKDPRICLRMGEWQPVSDKYNDAIRTAKGKYIVFLNPYDYITQKDWLEKTLSVFDDTEVDLAGYKNGLSGKMEVKNCCCADYHNFIYKLQTIRDNKIVFEDFSLYTGSVFFTKYCLASKYAYFTEKYVMRSESFKRTSIYAEEAKLILRAMVWLLEVAKQNNLPELGRTITEKLNSENYVRLITDSTYGFYINESSVNNSKEDFQTGVLSLLVQANELAVLYPEDNAVLRTLSEFISKRHLWLENV